MPPDIIRKLAAVINSGIKAEVQVVYLLAVGREPAVAEARYVTGITRHLAALILLGPKLEESYRR